MTNERREIENNFVKEVITHIENHNPQRKFHADRVAVYATATANELGITGDALFHLRCAATIHDFWKLEIPSEILESADPFPGAFKTTPESLRERLIPFGMETDRTWLHVLATQYIHYENMSETYPPIESRIILVAVAFDVMTHQQPWKNKKSESEAINEIKELAGSQFDPDVVNAFLSVQPLIQPVDLTGFDV